MEFCRNHHEGLNRVRRFRIAAPESESRTTPDRAGPKSTIRPAARDRLEHCTLSLSSSRFWNPEGGLADVLPDAVLFEEVRSIARDLDRERGQKPTFELDW